MPTENKEKATVSFEVEKYKYDALSAYLSMKNSSVERFMRKHFDEGYLQEVDEPVRKYVEFINGIKATPSQVKRNVPRRTQRAENRTRVSKDERKDNNEDQTHKS